MNLKTNKVTDALGRFYKEIIDEEKLLS